KTLTAITNESTDAEIESFHKTYTDRALGFSYLGSRDEIDYGLLVLGYQPAGGLTPDEDYADDPSGNQRGKEYPESYDPSLETFCLYYTGETRGEFSGTTGQITPRTPADIEDITPKTPNFARLVEIGSLATFSNERGWFLTRFSIVKLLDDNSLWIVAAPAFEPDDYALDEVPFVAPQSRAFPLDGFQDPISCARLKLNEESFEYDEGIQQEVPSRKIASKPFDIEHVHSGGFVLRTGPSKY
ncbi:MAG: hypothetical protein Q9165_008888, partial [Trypethelium subeluteriae]